MRRGLLAYLTPVVALSIAGIAAYYSVFGLSKLFAGAAFGVIIMASALEVGKLLGASLLHTYWKKLSAWLRVYLTIAVLTLMFITSAGIYGYLSSAYETTAAHSEIVNKELAVIEMKKNRFIESKTELSNEKTQLVKSINDLRISISNPHQVQYIDRESGQLITTTSSSTRRALQKELNKAISDRDTIAIKIEAASDSISKLDIVMLNKELSNEAERELGPLKYLAKVLDMPMDTVINWFMLLIIFVFDPLAVVLIIIVNIIWKRNPEEIKKLNKIKDEEKTIPSGIKISPDENASVLNERARDKNWRENKKMQYSKIFNRIPEDIKFDDENSKSNDESDEKKEIKAATSNSSESKNDEVEEIKEIKEEEKIEPKKDEYIKKEVVIRERPINKGKRPSANKKKKSKGRPVKKKKIINTSTSLGKGLSGLDKKHNE
jgi:hypothetical protein